MGAGASIGCPVSHSEIRHIFVRRGDRIAKVTFKFPCLQSELEESVALALDLDRKSKLILKDREGSVVVCNSGIMSNKISAPYTVEEINETSKDMLVNAATTLGVQLQKVLKTEETKKQFEQRLATLERRLESNVPYTLSGGEIDVSYRTITTEESLKILEIDKLKAAVKELQDQSTTRSIDFTRLRPSVSSQDMLYVPLCETDVIKRIRRDVLDFAKYQLSEETIAYLKKPTFDIWQWDPNEMLCLLEHMYHELGIVTALNMNPNVLRRWLLVVQENYRNNPFHNFRHCFCVAQMLYGLLNECELVDKLSPNVLATLLTSAICHDLDHPGFNNTYQINAHTELAIRYNDVSPLENHHCAVCFKILANPDWNIFGNVEEKQYKDIRAGIIRLILATDMAHHAEILESFRSIVDHFDFGSPEHVSHLQMVLIKACDISNEVRPLDVSGPWVDCLLEEYFQQAEREKQEGLPIAPFMDPAKVTKSSAQLGFIQYVLMPLFEALTKLFPSVEELMVIPLRQAKEFYENLQHEEEKERDKLAELTQPKS